MFFLLDVIALNCKIKLEIIQIKINESINNRYFRNINF